MLGADNPLPLWEIALECVKRRQDMTAFRKPMSVDITRSQRFDVTWTIYAIKFRKQFAKIASRCIRVRCLSPAVRFISLSREVVGVVYLSAMSHFSFLPCQYSNLLPQD